MARPYARAGGKRLISITFKVTEETKEELVEEADADSRTVSDYVRLIVERRPKPDKKAAP